MPKFYHLIVGLFITYNYVEQVGVLHAHICVVVDIYIGVVGYVYTVDCCVGQLFVVVQFLKCDTSLLQLMVE